MNSFTQSRFIYAAAMISVIGLGLLWRSHLLPLLVFATKYGGDALWALLVYLGFGFLFIRTSILKISLLALAFVWAVEFSQLYHAPWIDSIRATLPGRLVLGSTFNSPDLIAYVLGIGLGALLENFLRKFQDK